MDPASRYHLTEQLFEGEFATVFRAQDRELGREVAVKQIHAQYLTNPAQLDRYWQEAQLLASLDHPYILTVYDIVRQRGWLIMELMQGSVEQNLRGQPIDLDFLRVVLICGLHALKVLEQNGIVHGDVKPGNLLLDRAGRVKLGDFGIARRLSGDDGSLVKGTTKYMAPEVVSDQSGPVGPHSDLYSLGFTAYELMCGTNFESLFPGLDMYGGNRQMAWIMWHASLDRRLPEIERVLQGVPDDLRHVIQRLVEKDPSRRYRSADEALGDLRTKGQLPGAKPEEEEAEEAKPPDPLAKVKRYLAVGVASASVMLCLAMLISPGEQPEPPAAKQAARPSEGVLRHVDLDRSRLMIEPPDRGRPFPVEFDPQRDTILLDQRRASLDELTEGDRIEVHRYTSEDGTRKLEVIASRDVARITGQIVALDTNNAEITIADEQGRQQRVYLPRTVEIVFNGSPSLGRRKAIFSDLRKGDRATLQHVPDGEVRRVTEIRVERTMPLQGTVVSVDARQGMLSVRESGNPSGRVVQLPLAEDCTIAIEGVSPGGSSANRTLADLRPGDRIVAEHDTHFLEIKASRVTSDAGVVQRIDRESRVVRVKLNDTGNHVDFAVDEDCRIEASTESGPRPFAFEQLRAGDSTSIIHDAPNLQSPTALAIEVQPQPNERAWAIVIGQHSYLNMPALTQARSDAEAMRDALRVDYRVPVEQLLYASNLGQAQLRQRVEAHLQSVPARSQLIVYFAGRGFMAGGVALLAAQDFDPQRAEHTGVRLGWLVRTMEGCEAQEKLLLLDVCRPPSDAGAPEPSPTKLVESLKPNPRRPVSTSVTVVVCNQSQDAEASPEEQRFAETTATAFAGGADANRDYQVTATEMFAFLKSRLTSSGGKPAVQLYLPDTTPARLSEAAQRGVLKMLGSLGASQVDTGELKAQVARLDALAPKQPDFKLAGGLVLLKHGKTSFAKDYFEQVLLEHPDSLPAHHALAWLAFLSKDYPDGVEHLEKLAAKLPDLEAPDGMGAYARHLTQWSGSLSGYLSYVADQESISLDRLLAAVSAHGEPAKRLFQQGYQEVGRRKKELRDAYEAAFSEAEKTSLRFRAKTLTTYVTFDYEPAAAYLKTRLEY